MCVIFSSLDLRSDYHHIGVTPEAKPKTAFAIISGKSYWNMTPFDVCSLPSVFCYFMSLVLSGLDICFAYLDDILVYSSSWKEYLKHLEVVFMLLKEANLK